MIVRYSRSAERDLSDIRRHIAQDSEKDADNVIARILQSIRYLEFFPEMGHVGAVAGTRELVIAGLPFKAVYKLGSGAVLVVAIIHASRQWPPSIG